LVTHNGKYDSKQFSRNGNQSLGFGHTALQVLLVFMVHYAPFANRVECGKVQEFA
jgi:hypothetical protein